MNANKRLVFATNNPNKLKEAREIISDGFEIVSLSEIGCHDEIPETADTLEGNALIKARWIKERYGYDCFADDTGLMVDALGGAPGVYSARYAGEHCSPADNVAKMLREMKGETNRKAHFATVIALVADGSERTFEGRVDGSISESPRGDSGFGYDPIFIPDESGKCFAEMTSEDKNSISHRGRAMRKLRDFLCAFVVVMFAGLIAPDSHAEQWRLHGTYAGQMEEVIDTPDYVYFLGTKTLYNPDNPVISTLNGILFRYDKKGEEMIVLDRSNLLSGNNVKAAAYNYDRKYLAVALEDGTINFIYDTGEVRTIQSLKLSDSSLDKTVNDITFAPHENQVYLATNFGYVVLNDVLNEVAFSRIFNRVIRSAASFKGKVWLSDNEGIYYGDSHAFNFRDFKKVPNMGRAWYLTPIGDEQMFFLHGSRSDRHCAKIVYNENGDCWPSVVLPMALVSVMRNGEGVVALSKSTIDLVNKSLERKTYDTPPGYGASLVGSCNGRDFWFSSGKEGISNLSAPAQAGGKWTVKADRFFPNVANPYECSSMAYHNKYGMLVRNHGYETVFNGRIYNEDDMISGYKDMQWQPLSTTFRDPDGLRCDNPWGTAIDPNNTDHVYCGSMRSGLFRLDLANPEKSMKFGKPTDFRGDQNKPGYVVIGPENPEGAWTEMCMFAPPMFDNDGVLWTTYVYPERPSGDPLAEYTELLAWTPEDRAATTSASTFREWKKLRFEGYSMNNMPLLLPLKHSSNRNIVLSYGNHKASPMLILNHGGTIDNISDDKVTRMKDIHDQDGENLDLFGIYCWYEDPQTGLVWVGYNDGLFTFSPKDAMTDPTSVRRVKVPRNDGTNLADHLLSGVRLNCITSDPSGRKWFGTVGAGLVCTSADGREILNTYTPDNSMLSGSSVYAMCYNPSSNSMMISTDKGLCELFLGSSAAGDDGDDVRCYPNPVRPDYFGFVNIEGLGQDAMVKIVDTAGNLIKECGQEVNGKVEWDVTNIHHKRVPGGVYFVLASSGPNGDSYAKVSKILVVE